MTSPEAQATTSDDAVAAAPASVATRPYRADCANCGTALIGKYCHNCSQSSAPTRLTAKEAVHDLIYMLFKLDGKFAKSVKLLIAKPGRLSRDYQDGVVVPYVKPLRLIFIVSLIVSVLFAVADVKVMQHVINFTPEARVVRDAEGFPQLQGAEEDLLAAQRTVKRQAPPPEFMASLERELARPGTSWMDDKQLRLWKALSVGDPMRDTWAKGLPFLFLAISPLFAGVLALFYRRRGFLYVDHLVFAVHVNTFFLLTILLTAAISFISPKIADWGLEVPLMAVYVVVACRTFYGGSWLQSALKGVLLTAADVALLFVAILGMYLSAYFLV